MFELIPSLLRRQFDLIGRLRFEVPVPRGLPIDPILPDITDAVRHHPCIVLQAEPGAGKTTRVPGALLDAGLAGDGDIVVLEPRRIAARASAEFVARARGGRVGGEVGYRVRFEQVGDHATRLWFITEGIFGRRLVSDPFLEGVGIVILDEFHERHVAGDVALTTLRELQQTLRPDLRLVVMSATIEADRVAHYLDNCPVIHSHGRHYPVDVQYEAATDTAPVWDRCARAVRTTLAQGEGDILVFLPGAAEIRRTAERLGGLPNVAVLTLHGDMPLEEQRRVIEPGPQRRVVLSTNVAETSLTIDGITTVIDSGLVRESRLDARHGLNRLRTLSISRASADQRAGRAGRTAPGRCVRLWTRAENLGRREHDTPEILRLDLSAMLLEISAWGLRRPEDLIWLDSPQPTAMAHAERLLRALGAIDVERRVSDVGQRMLRFGVEPRLARMLVAAEDLGCASQAATLAALASERDIFREQRAFGGRTTELHTGQSDLLVRLAAFEEAARSHWDARTCERLGIDRGVARAVDRVRSQLARRGGGVAGVKTKDDALLRCIAAGFPDRVCRRRAEGLLTAVMVGNTGLVQSEHSVVREPELFVAIDVDGSKRRGQVESIVRIASAVHREWLAEIAPGALSVQVDTIYDSERQRVVEQRRQCFLDLVLDEKISTKVDPSRAGEVLAAAVLAAPLARQEMLGHFENIVERVRFLRATLGESDFPDADEFADDVIRSACVGQTTMASLRGLEWTKWARATLTHPQRQALEREAPEKLDLPSGRSASIHYSRERAPFVAVRIQHAFGLRQSPRLARGRVAVVFELLAPNQRPAQVTDDLESFWKRGYPEVRKLLRGRYPKHSWPEDPFSPETGRR